MRKNDLDDQYSIFPYFEDHDPLSACYSLINNIKRFSSFQYYSFLYNKALF